MSLAQNSLSDLVLFDVIPALERCLHGKSQKLRYARRSGEKLALQNPMQCLPRFHIYP